MFANCKGLLNSWAELVDKRSQRIPQIVYKAPFRSSSAVPGSLAEEEWKKVEQRVEGIELAGLFPLANAMFTTHSINIKVGMILGMIHAQLGIQTSAQTE